MSDIPNEGEDLTGPTQGGESPPSSHDLARASDAVAAALSRRPPDVSADDPRVVHGAPISRDLPPSYGRDRLYAVVRGPRQIAVFWDVHPETAQRLATGRWGLVVRTEDGVRRVDVRYSARCWYVDVASAAEACVIEFGPLDDADTVAPIAAASLTAAGPGPALSDQASEAAWGNGASHESGMRLDTVRHREPQADTDALLERCRVAAGPTSPAHSWSQAAASRVPAD